MDFEDWLYEALGLAPELRNPDFVAATSMSRQAWQEAVEDLVATMRERFDQPTFGLPEAEISVHYHLPIRRFGKLVKAHLGCPP
jgi:hypothetical protein